MDSTPLPVDANGNPFYKPAFWLPSREYSKIYSEINQIYFAQYSGKHIAAHPSFDLNGRACVYWFENHGFNNYNIFMKTLDDH